MRVLIAGKIRFEGEDAARIIRDSEKLIQESRLEEGCTAYDWAVDPLLPDTIHVFEEWESERDLGAHFIGPSYIAMRGHLQSLTITAMDVNMYSAVGVEPVYTEDGQPRDAIFGVAIGREAPT